MKLKLSLSQECAEKHSLSRPSTERLQGMHGNLLRPNIPSQSIISVDIYIQPPSASGDRHEKTFPVHMGCLCPQGSFRHGVGASHRVPHRHDHLQTEKMLERMNRVFQRHHGRGMSAQRRTALQHERRTGPRLEGRLRLSARRASGRKAADRHGHSVHRPPRAE